MHSLISIFKYFQTRNKQNIIFTGYFYKEHAIVILENVSTLAVPDKRGSTWKRKYLEIV